MSGLLLYDLDLDPSPFVRSQTSDNSDWLFHNKLLQLVPICMAGGEKAVLAWLMYLNSLIPQTTMTIIYRGEAGW